MSYMKNRYGNKSTGFILIVFIILLLLCLLPSFTFAAKTTKSMVRSVVSGWLKEESHKFGESLHLQIDKIFAYGDDFDEELYFVVELRPEGYIIISPDDEIEPIIAFSSRGHYAEDINNPLTSLIKKDMTGRRDRVRNNALVYKSSNKNKNGKDKNSQIQKRSKQKWEKYKNKAKESEGLYTLDEEQLYSSVSSVSDVRIAPIVETRWSQSQARDSNNQYQNLYNIYTPSNSLSGCVATAIAQVLHYNSFPVSGVGQISKTIYYNSGGLTGTTVGGDGGGGAYDWSLMTTVPAEQPYDSDRWNMVGALMYDAGISVNMNYSNSASGAQMSAVAPAFTNVFQYAQAIRTYNYDYQDHSDEYKKVLNSNLNAGYPAILGIVNTSGWSGHAVVADGYGYDGDTLYHHVNMGWGGNSDAWYNLPSIGSYNSLPELIYNIFPEKTGEIISGRVVDQIGSPRSGILVEIQSQSGGTLYTDTTDTKGNYGIIVPSNDTYNLSADYATVDAVAVGKSSISSSANLVDIDITVVDSIVADTKSDLIWQNVNSGQILTWFMDGDKTAEEIFQGSIVSSMAQEWNIKGMGDFDGDGKGDLLWHNSITGMVFLWFLDDLRPAEQISQGAIWDSMPSDWQIKGTGDFDGDGKDDILWQNISTGMVFIWCLNGNTRADQLTQGAIWDSMPADWIIQGTGDFNGDGKDDILWRNSNTGMVYLWCLNGTQQADQITQGSIWDSMPQDWLIDRIADFNGDGKADIFWRNSNTGQLFMWLMNGTDRADTLSQGEIWSTMPSEWQTTAVGDFNDDGNADLLWRNSSTGHLLAWYMNGLSKADQIAQATIWSSMPEEWQIKATGHVNGL